MVIYRLTNLGEDISHNPMGERTPGRMVVYYLARRGMASSDQLYANIPGLTPWRLAKLVRSGVIYNNKRPVVA